MSLPAEPGDRGNTDEGMARIYALVILCHATVITTLWWFGRAFSR